MVIHINRTKKYPTKANQNTQKNEIRNPTQTYQVTVWKGISYFSTEKPDRHKKISINER